METTEVKLQIENWEPSQDILDWARDNIQEDPDTKYEYIQELLDMIYERGECSPNKTDDEFLLKFLRARHFIVRKAHRLMVNYFNFKESNPQYFNDVDVFKLREISKMTVFQIPPYRDQHGRRMMIFKPGDWNPEECNLNELFQLLLGVLEVAVTEPQTQIKGVIAIVDLSDISFNLAWYLSPSYVKNLISIAITSFPLRIEALHFVHSSWIFDTTWSWVKPLLPEIASERIFFHGDNLENLQNYIDQKCLPKIYGGIHDDCLAIRWIDEIILKNENCLKVFEEMGYGDVRRLAEEINKN